MEPLVLILVDVGTKERAETTLISTLRSLRFSQVIERASLHHTLEVIENGAEKASRQTRTVERRCKLVLIL